jgi:DNA-binding beta-propeller fold protein YncE
MVHSGDFFNSLKCFRTPGYNGNSGNGQFGEEAMKSKCVNWAVLIALVVAAAVGEKWLASAAFSAQAAQPQGRSLPIFEVDRAWPKVPSQWKLGDASSIAIDAQDNIWVLHRPRTLKPEQAAMAAPPVIVFDRAGNYIKAWGGAGNGYEWPEREHGIHIDYRGFVWLGGNSCPTNGLPGLKAVADDQLLKFTQEGKFVMQIGRSNQSKGNADTRNLHRPADVWVYPQTNELFVADGYGNHRVAVFDADRGKFKRMWGAFGNKPLDDDHCEVVRPASFSDSGPQQFSTVHAIRVANDGTVYVADREYRRVQMFTKDGKFLKQLVRNSVPFARDLALSPDANQQFLYVGGGNGIFIVDRKTLEIVGNVQPTGMIGPGHEIATDSKGNLYIAQTTSGLQKLTFKGMSQAGR